MSPSTSLCHLNSSTVGRSSCEHHAIPHLGSCTILLSYSWAWHVMQILFFRSCPSYLFSLKFWIWFQVIVDPNEFQYQIFTVLHALQSGTMFAFFIFLLPPCPFIIIVVLCSLIHMKCVFVRSILLMGCCSNKLLFQLHILPSVFTNSFGDHLVSAYQPLPISHGGLQWACILDEELAQIDLGVFWARQTGIIMVLRKIVQILPSGSFCMEDLIWIDHVVRGNMKPLCFLSSSRTNWTITLRGNNTVLILPANKSKKS